MTDQNYYSLSVTAKKNQRWSSCSLQASFRVFRGKTAPLRSILRSLATRRHLHELRIELAEHRDQITLRRHHLADVFVSHRHFVEARGNQRHPALAEKTVHVLPIKLLVRRFATHHPPRAVRR